MKKEILFATQNKAKLERLRLSLGDNFTIIGLSDAGIKTQAKEDGLSPTENALQKARTCFKKTSKPSFAMDYGFFIEGLDEKDQPGPSVKRIVPKPDGHEVDDDDVLNFYSGLVERLGGKANAYWLRSVALVSPKGEFTHETTRPKILVSTPSQTRIAGFPMASLQVIPDIDKYESEMTAEELQRSSFTGDDEMRDFIVEHS